MSVQEPTCRGLRVKTLDDARTIFHGVHLKLLPMVSRRLSSEERSRIRPGDVYVWEEKTQHHVEQAGLSIERWTDCFAWGPSRVRDEFLFYTQKDREYRRSNNRRNDMPPQAPGERWHKQTLSVIVKDPHDPYSFPRKWHMTAYFYRENLESVQQALAHIPTPPEGMYEKARSNRPAARPSQAHSSVSPSSNEDDGASTVYSAAAYRGPGSPMRSAPSYANYRAAPYAHTPPSPSSSSSSGRRMSISSVSGSSMTMSDGMGMGMGVQRPSLPSLSVPRSYEHVRMSMSMMPPPSMGMDVDASSVRLRPLGYDALAPPPPPHSSDFRLPSPGSPSRLPEIVFSRDSPDERRLSNASANANAGRRREDDAALRMFT